MSYKIRVKAVPDSDPNADGEWIEIAVLADTKMNNLWYWKDVEDALSPFLPEGVHMVAYQIEKEKEQ